MFPDYIPFIFIRYSLSIQKRQHRELFTEFLNITNGACLTCQHQTPIKWTASLYWWPIWKLYQPLHWLIFSITNQYPCTKWQGKKLRQIVDDRYTARVLLGLSQTYKNNLGENFDVQTSATICQNGNAPCSGNGSSTLNGCDETNISNDGGSNEDENYLNNAVGTTMGADQSTTTKRARRRGKYTPQEREKIRYLEPNLNSILSTAHREAYHNAHNF